MSQWIGTKEVGLSPGQTGGEVGGQQVYRDPSSDITKVYIQTESIQTTTGYPGDRVLVEVGGQKFYTGRGEVPEIGSYRRETGFTSVRRTGMMTPAEQERQYQEQRGLQPAQQVPSPFMIGQVQYAPGSPFGTGYFTSPAYQSPTEQMQFPAYLVGRNESEFRVIPRYGQVMPRDIYEGLYQSRTEQTYKRTLPENITLSPFSIEFYKGAAGISERVRGFEIPKSLTSGIVPAIFPQFGAAPMLKESAARLIEFGGTAPGSLEIYGKTAISKPLSLPSMVAYEITTKTAGIGKQAVSEPAQLLSDLFVTSAAFKMTGAARAGIKEFKPSFEPTMRSESFYAARDVFKGYGKDLIESYKEKIPSFERKPVHEIEILPRYTPRTEPIGEMRGFSEEQLTAARSQLSEMSTIRPSTKQVGVFDISKYTSKTLTFLKGRFEGIEKGSSLFAQYPTGKRGGLPRGGAFAEFRASMEGKKPFIDVGIKQKDISVIDRRKVKTIKSEIITEAPKLDISDSFFAKELKEMEMLKIKPKKTTARPEDIFKITAKPKEYSIEREIRTSTGQILIQKQLLKPLELKTELITPSVRTSIKPSLKLFPQVKTSSKIDTLMQLRLKTLTPTATGTRTPTRTTTRTAISPLIKSMVTPSTMTRVSVMPAIQTKTALRELTQTRTRIAVIPQTTTMFDIGIKKLPKPKPSTDLLPRMRKRKGRRSGFKYPEISRVASPSQIMKSMGNMFAAPKRRKSKPSRKGRKARR